MSDPTKLTNGTRTTIVAMTLIALFLLLASVVTVYIRPQTDPAILFPLVLGLIATIVSRLQSHLTQMETLAQAKEANIKATEAASKATEAVETTAKTAEVAAETKQHVQTLNSEIDGRMSDLLAAKDELLAEARHHAEEFKNTSEVAKDLASENTKALIDAALAMPTPPPVEPTHTDTEEHGS